MYKHQTNTLPKTLSDYLIKHSEVHNYPSRMFMITVFIKPKKVFSDWTKWITRPTYGIH